MNLRVDSAGRAVTSGAQTEIGGNDRYLALCRKHFIERTGEQNETCGGTSRNGP